MTKLRADEYAILISEKLHILAREVAYGTSTKQSFAAAMVRIAQLSDAYEVVRAADAEKQKWGMRRSTAGIGNLSGLNQQ